MEHAISVVFGGLFHPRLVGGHELSQMIEWHQPILHPLGVELHEIQILPDIHQSTPHHGTPRSSISSAHFTGSDRQALVIESAPTRGIDIALIMYFHQTQRIDPVDWVGANISIEVQATIQVQRIFRDATPHAWMIVPRAIEVEPTRIQLSPSKLPQSQVAAKFDFRAGARSGFQSDIFWFFENQKLAKAAISWFKEHTSLSEIGCGGPTRIRTWNQRIMSPLL